MRAGDLVRVKRLYLFYPGSDPPDRLHTGTVECTDTIMFLGDVYDHPHWCMFFSKVLVADGRVGWIRSDGLEVVE